MLFTNLLFKKATIGWFSRALKVMIGSNSAVTSSVVTIRNFSDYVIYLVTYLKTTDKQKECRKGKFIHAARTRMHLGPNKRTICIVYYPRRKIVEIMYVVYIVYYKGTITTYGKSIRVWSFVIILHISYFIVLSYLDLSRRFFSLIVTKCWAFKCNEELGTNFILGSFDKNWCLYEQ